MCSASMKLSCMVVIRLTFPLVAAEGNFLRASLATLLTDSWNPCNESIVFY